MLGKWLKMGHGKGFRTFQEQSIQRASVLIYEICAPVVWVMAVCVCVSQDTGVGLRVCRCIHTCLALCVHGVVCSCLWLWLCIS